MKSQVTTQYFRFLTKSGGYIWLQSNATLDQNSRASRQVFVFVNNVLT